MINKVSLSSFMNKICIFDIFQIKFHPSLGDIPIQPYEVGKGDSADTMESDASIKNYEDVQDDLDKKIRQAQNGLDGIIDNNVMMKKPDDLDGSLTSKKKNQEKMIKQEWFKGLCENSAHLDKKLGDEKRNEMEINNFSKRPLLKPERRENDGTVRNC